MPVGFVSKEEACDKLTKSSSAWLVSVEFVTKSSAASANAEYCDANASLVASSGVPKGTVSSRKLCECR